MYQGVDEDHTAHTIRSHTPVLPVSPNQPYPVPRYVYMSWYRITDYRP